MDGTKLQSKIYIGYGKAAKRIGFDYQQFRATSSSYPLSTTALQTLPVSFTTNFKYSAPNKYGKADWLGLFDAREFAVGDYLVGRQGTFFVAAMQDTLPIYCVQTNRVVSVLRVSQDAPVGLGSWAGDKRATTEVAFMQGWPASIIQGTKGETNEAKLPGDVKTPWWAILMPAWPGLILRTSDIIRDDLDRKYVISSAELTDMGWRITAMQAQV
ncbi:hypothetical protein [Pseudomonas fluorescens]|uniref:Uncharacterized protein n=1 Tax=Pseudomonas fluorescens TaxID=294 RepID=A0A5E7VA15_PSEFL|nr:hypothetical protein [Pseudomonas fluorescens]VVQ19939.1 hypothetical protein PS941_04897 [Pseudomonas fluorescens]